jgi:hypothetical protein
VHARRLRAGFVDRADVAHVERAVGANAHAIRRRQPS